MIRALLVDMDGTLVDTHAANVAAYRQALQDLNVVVPDGLDRCVGVLAWRQMFRELLPHESTEMHEAVAVRKRDIYERFLDRVTVNEALVGLLQDVKGRWKAALVTSASAVSARTVLRCKGLSDLFDIIVTSDDVTEPKPSPEPFAVAARLLGCGPHECVVLEDSSIGVQAAAGFGAQTWQVHWPHK